MHAIKFKKIPKEITICKRIVIFLLYYNIYVICQNKESKERKNLNILIWFTYTLKNEI